MDKERNMNNEDKWIPVYESLPALFLAVTLCSDYKNSINYNQNISLNTDVTVVYLSTWFQKAFYFGTRLAESCPKLIRIETNRSSQSTG